MKSHLLNKMQAKISILTAIFMLSVVSCIKDYDFDTKDINLRSGQFAAPIAKLQIPLFESIERFMEIEGLKYDPITRILLIQYIHSEKIEWSDDIKIDDFEDTWRTEIPPIGGWIPDGVEYELPERIYENFIKLQASEDDDSYVSFAELAGGTFEISVTLPTGNFTSWNIDIVIPMLQKGGDPFTLNFNKDENIMVKNVDLAGYTIETDGNNELKTDSRFTGRATGAPPTGNFEINFKIKDVEFNYLVGYFGKFDIEQSGEMEFDFFDQLDIDGDMNLRGITVITKITNHAGLPMNVDVDVNFTNDDETSSKELLTMSGVDVPAATSVTNPGILNRQDPISTLELDLKNQSFTKLKFAVDGKANHNNPPLGGSIVPNFLQKRDYMAEIEMTINVPFDFKLTYSRSDTVGFDYRDIMNGFGGDHAQEFSESISNFTIYLSIDNGMPFDIDLDIYATNGAGTIRVPISNDLDIKAQSGTQPFSISLSQNILRQLWDNDVKNVVIASSAKTMKDGNPDFVQVTKDAYLNIGLSIEFEAETPRSILPF